jgi:hypothetical protein
MSLFRRRLFARHQRGRRRRSRLGQLSLRQQNNLLRGLIARRARIVHDDRVRALETARHEAGRSRRRSKLTAFLGPLLRRSRDVVRAAQPAGQPLNAAGCRHHLHRGADEEHVAAIDRLRRCLGQCKPQRVMKCSTSSCEARRIPPAGIAANEPALRELVPFVQRRAAGARFAAQIGQAAAGRNGGSACSLLTRQ